MAGYQNSLYSLKPDCFITFDGDTLFDNQGYLRTPNIPDVSGNENNAYILATSNAIKSYSLGTYSLVDREDGIDQYSMTFASRGYIGADVPADVFPYPSAIAEIFHSDTLECKDEFTFSFLFKKLDRDNWFRTAKYNPSTGKYETQNNGYYKDFSRTIFQKGDDVWMRWRKSGWSNYDYLDFKFPGPTGSNNDYTYRFDLQNGGGLNILNTSNYTGRQVHIAMTREKLKIGAALFQTVDRVYIDGIKYFERKSQVTNEPSTALNTSSIFIGGNQSVFNSENLNDRQTTPLLIDNFAVWNKKCLTDDEISWLYKKVYEYGDYTRRWDPQLYVQMNESSLNPNSPQQPGTISVNKNNANLTYVGIGSQLTPGIMGPKRLIYTPAMGFKASAMAKITSSNYTNPVLSVNNNQDWTLDLFVSFTSSERGVIFSALTDTWPYKGILIEANVNNGIHQSGSIQVSLEDNLSISTDLLDAFGNTVKFNDGEFHFITVVRRNSQFEFWLDGVLQGSRAGNNGTINNNFGQIYLMNSMPDQLAVTGSLCQIAFFTYAMQPSNIRARSYFFTRTVVEGYVTLRGVPHPATVRCYERSTGEFVVEGTADPTTGWYKIDVWTENYMDVMFFDIKDPAVRPRALGPYLAYEYTDIDDMP